MAGIAIVAIPEEDDPVWKVSSEKVPHLTLLYLEGPLENEENTILFIQHVVQTSMKRFGMSVDRRGVLGEENADVVFLDKTFGGKDLLAARGFFLSNTDILQAYKRAVQYPVFTPHVTLGFPATPAKEGDKLHWINFDKVAVWTGDYEGPEFELERDTSMEMDVPSAWAEDEHFSDYLKHFGTKGMRWGVRRAVGKGGLVIGKPASPGSSKSKSDDDELTPMKIKRGKGSADHQRMMKNLDKKMENLSTADIKALSARIEAVNKLKTQTDAQKAAKASMAKKLTSWALGQVTSGVKKETGNWIENQSGGLTKKILPDLVGDFQKSKAKADKAKAKADSKTKETSSSGSTQETKTRTVKAEFIQPNSAPKSPERQKAIESLVYEITTLEKKKGG